MITLEALRQRPDTAVDPDAIRTKTNATLMLVLGGTQLLYRFSFSPLAAIGVALVGVAMLVGAQTLLEKRIPRTWDGVVGERALMAAMVFAVGTVWWQSPIVLVPTAYAGWLVWQYHRDRPTPPWWHAVPAELVERFATSPSPALGPLCDQWAAWERAPVADRVATRQAVIAAIVAIEQAESARATSAAEPFDVALRVRARDAEAASVAAVNAAERALGVPPAG